MLVLLVGEEAGEEVGVVSGLVGGVRISSLLMSSCVSLVAAKVSIAGTAGISAVQVWVGSS